MLLGHRVGQLSSVVFCKKRMKNYKEKIENSLKMMINISWGKLSTIHT